jgi:hypothetical protein
MLSLKPDYEASAQRIAAFWEREIIDRAVVQFALYKPEEEWIPLPASRHSTPAERWQDAQYQAEWALANLSNQLFLGDSLPVAWPNLGPDVLAGFYGCPLQFGNYGTSWSKPILHTWEAADEVAFDWNSPFLHKVDQMTGALLEVGKGLFLTGLTDLHPGGDCLAALRGPQNLAMDLLICPEQVKALLVRIESDFTAVYDRFYVRLRAAGLPITTWTPLLCDGKYYLPSNDFSIMISRRMFEEFFLPGLIGECQFLDRSLYHLDGPGALRHLDCLLHIPELDAVQFVPTVGDAAFAKWAGVYQRIQDAGKGVQVTCEMGEIDQVMQALRPEGVYLVVNDVQSRDMADTLLRKLKRWSLNGYRQCIR